MVIRFSILIGFVFFAYLLLLFRVSQLQLVKGDYYSGRSQLEVLASRVLSANRGIIYFSDKDGSRLPAVLNRNFPLIYAVPKAIEDSVEAANVLSPILNKPVGELKDIFSSADDSYRVLIKKADSALARKVEGSKIKGVYVDTESARFYPLGSVASQLLGFVGPSSDGSPDSGHYGLEEFYNAKLSGRPGAIPDNKKGAAKPAAGEDLVLTIDPNIQVQAEKVLNNLISTYKATGGSVIVEDPETGKILAMGSLPSFDPNNYGSANVSNFLNPVTQKIYEPGSVFKVITMAAGIDSGKITPEMTYIDTGSITLNGRTIQNYDFRKRGAYGKVTMTNVIEHSINTGAVFAERQIGREIFTSYLRNFGFGEKTGISLPGELKGDLRRLSPKERDVAFATASYGQGVAVTPIELITAVSAIANGGRLMRPYVDASMKPKVIRRVIGESTAKVVTEMMVSAVDKADVAKINGYTIAGKTGTAFVPDFRKGGYTDDVINTYVGFGPANNPKFVALIKLDEPKGAPLAGLSVVPAFRNLAQFILNYYGVQPDRIHQ